ncbi:SLAP domain-containing protein [Lactobacillus sp. ESL0791]|uniref:SLAP domain-containing protein n=1 Tax=Lactobacillus sp. ESL0791 TaxID=2983234 RepID=UPI0023F66563|nr:SLAP domain-containing protein [Lactobacillus sp. ESL0791]MDF7639607.1 SLAP domain-containing protein [Lactobacillus sp. ESL0791]
MKKNKKIAISLAAVMLATPPIISTMTNQVHAIETANQNSTEGTLTLNHNTRIYNRKGQKLSSYLRSSSLLKKGTTVKYEAKIQAIDDPSTKRYSFHDNKWNWFYLPYETIKGQEYYSIGHGGYIKAANIGQINNYQLYTNEATGVIKDLKYSRTPGKEPVFDYHAVKTNKYLTVGTKVTITQQAGIYDLSEHAYGNQGITEFYKIKNSNEYVWTNTVNVKSRQAILPYNLTGEKKKYPISSKD